MWQFSLGESSGKFLYGLYMYPALKLQNYVQIGENIFDREWDVLVVLDACRVDALRTVSGEYDFLNEVESMTSVGSTSKEWYLHTFADKDVSDVSLISGNGWISRMFEQEPDWKYWTITKDSWWHDQRFLDSLLERDLPRDSDFDNYLPVVGTTGGDIGTTPLPEEVTDAAIYTGRNRDPSRLIIHYMQPHEPYIHEREGASLPEIHKSPFDSLKEGETTVQEICDAYLGNLREVLDSVERLLKNIEAPRVAITADHGELFGEWGMYTHPAAFPHPNVRKVPWATTEAADTGESMVKAPKTKTNSTPKQRLEDLGYL